MHRLLSIFVSLWLLISVLITVAIQFPIPYSCDGYPVLENIEDGIASNLIIDPRTGIQWADTELHRSPVQAMMQSVTGQYQLIEASDNLLILKDQTAETNIKSINIQTLTGVAWSKDDTGVLIRDYLADTSQNQITGINTTTGEIVFQDRYPARMRWRQDRHATDYIYAQMVLEGEELRYGIQFMNIQTGVITHFQNPTQFPYLWSDSERYVASQHRVVISIIDPVTGDFHPEFAEPVIGREFQWQGDDALWFNRLRDNRSSVWRATLADGTVEQMLDNMRLLKISPDGEWAVVHATRIDDLAYVHLPSQTSYPLDIIQGARMPIVTFEFSPDEQCIATRVDEEHHQRMILFDLNRRRFVTRYITIDAAYRTLSWHVTDELAIVGE